MPARNSPRSDEPRTRRARVVMRRLACTDHAPRALGADRAATRAERSYSTPTGTNGPARCSRPGSGDASRSSSHPATRDQRVEVDARLHALAVEEVDEVLGRDVARRVRGERAAAEAADGRVEQRRARLQARDRVRIARVAGVVEMEADRRACRGAEGGGHEPAHLGGDADADRVGEQHLVRARGRDERDVLDHDPRIDRALERAAERRGQRDVHAPARRLDRPGHLLRET